MTFVSRMALTWDLARDEDAPPGRHGRSGMLEECKTEPRTRRPCTPTGPAWATPARAAGPGRCREGDGAAGPAAHSTNQRMEITAALDAARSLPGRLEIVSDSTYVVNCFRDGWWERWVAKGWVNAAKKPVANRDLWEPLVDLYRAPPGRLRFRWVKGHGADPFNDLVDRLAVAAATSQQGGRGRGAAGTGFSRPGRTRLAVRRPLAGPRPLGECRSC